MMLLVLTRIITLSLPRLDDSVRVLSSLARLFVVAGFVRSLWKTLVTHMWWGAARRDAISADVGPMDNKLAFSYAPTGRVLIPARA